MNIRALRTLAPVALVAGVIWYVFVQFVYPLYRDMAWRSNASKAILAASSLHSVVAERIVSRPPGTPVNLGLRIEPEGAITGGFVAPDGTIVVGARLDYPNLLVGDTVEVVDVPRVDPKSGKVTWTCGATENSRRAYLPQACREVIALPSRR